LTDQKTNRLEALREALREWESEGGRSWAAANAQGKIMETLPALIEVAEAAERTIAEIDALAASVPPWEAPQDLPVLRAALAKLEER
jgi:hypothetical protein